MKKSFVTIFVTALLALFANPVFADIADPTASKGGSMLVPILFCGIVVALFVAFFKIKK